MGILAFSRFWHGKNTLSLKRLLFFGNRKLCTPYYSMVLIVMLDINKGHP